MSEIHDYSKEYKFLPLELIVFFDEFKIENGKVVPKTVIEFCFYYQEKYKTVEFPQPRIVSQICEKLIVASELSLVQRLGFDGADNSYVCFLDEKSFLNDELKFKLRNEILSFKVFGFKYIYEYYKPLVLPILHVRTDQSIGSSFLYRGGLVTAKHCIEHANKIAIKGISAESLKRSKFYTSKNKSMDLIFIEFPEEELNSIYLDEEANVLDEVIALGYPRIPGFHNFLTVEKADVSSRFTGSKGSVNSIAEDIWMRENLMLINARIKGGNSGGPIINHNGSVVGVASNLPEGRGNYDDLGYGVAIPIKFTNEIIDDKSCVFDVSGIEFIDFED